MVAARVRTAQRTCALFGSVLLMVTSAAAQNTDPSRIVGVWEPHTYLLKDGTTHDVTGLIFFTERHWTVLFFVVGSDRQPRRGSAEGGTYRLSGNQLVFTHHYHFSSGEAMQSLAASPLRMEIHDTSDAPREPSTIQIDGDQLVIHFPSGNAMEFVRK